MTQNEASRPDGWLREIYRASAATSQPTLVLISQVYVPDPAAVGQYMHQAAVTMVRHGYRVISITADSGFEEPSVRYPRYEQLDGVHVVRLPFASFGKNSLRDRLVGGGIFTTEALLLAASLPRIDHVLISTSPPMIGAAAIGLVRARGAKLSVWVMDLNPDQIVATGSLSAESLPVRSFEWLNRQTWNHADALITLDVQMAERMRPRVDRATPIHVIPPWPLFTPGELDPSAGQHFREAHGLHNKRVLMFSGNLSPHHPIDTLLQALPAFAAEERFACVFIGGGGARRRVEEFVRQHRLTNVLLLPYQPLDGLVESLSAADLHLVSMGEAMVGIVHPSKIYSALAVGRPILALGPRRCHIAAMVHNHHVGWHVEHGDVEGAVRALRELVEADATQLTALRQRAHAVVREHYNQEALMRQFHAVVTAGQDDTLRR